MAIAIKADGLTRRFGDVLAVDGLTLDIPMARIHGFLGPNGSGKSTTIRMLCGLLLPDSGSVSVLGYRVPEAAEAVRRRIGYMTQKFSLYDDLTVRENLSFVAEIHELPRAAGRTAIDRALDVYELAGLAGRRAGRMSGGQRQRLALAAATLHGPDLLLLDEPTSAVDPESRRDFWDRLFDLAGDGTTILVSTHYMDEAERCHGLSILDQGRLAAQGAPDELIRSLRGRVFQVSGTPANGLRAALEIQPGVLSVTQLGARLRVLTEPWAASDPEGTARRLAEALKGHGLTASVRPASASLEDVFVAVTRDSGRTRAA